jgi:serine phosphatase RsbU (regulator of sigma subunit)
MKFFKSRKGYSFELLQSSCRVSFYFLILCISFFNNVFANDMSSSKAQTYLQKHDTSSVNALNTRANDLRQSNTLLAKSTAKEALSLSKKIKYSLGEGAAYKTFAKIAKQENLFDTALWFYNLSYKAYTQALDHKQMALVLGNMANIYSSISNYEKAIELRFKSIKINESKKDLSGLLRDYGNLGIDYKTIGKYNEALTYQYLAVQLSKQLSDTNALMLALSNMGNIWLLKQQNDSAMYYYNTSLKYAKSLNNPLELANIYSCLGLLCQQQQNNIAAINNHHKALEIFESYNNETGIIICKANLAQLHFADAQIQNNNTLLKKSIHYAQEAFTLSKKLNIADYTIEAGKTLWQALELDNNHKQALLIFKEIVFIEDSIHSQETKVNIAQLLSVRENELNQLKIEKLKGEEKQQKKLLWLWISLGSIIVLILVLFLNSTQKQKKLLAHEKEIVVKKNTEITDSINYAKKIQEASLPPLSEIQSFLPKSFVFFKPRDIVSGDFYWFYKHSNSVAFIAIADCTGHGVPGAFMSMVGHSLLNEIIIEKQIHDSSQILNELHLMVQKSLNQNSNNSRDGMDIIVLKVDTQNQTLQCAQANRPVYIVDTQKGELLELKPNKFAIGGAQLSNNEVRKFSSHTLVLSHNLWVYCTSDGYADQFGGSLGKKFMTKNLKQTLLEVAKQDANLQASIIEKTFYTWQGKAEQVDDILLFGFSV